MLPTLYDPCPNAALEAMACGLPVVTSTKCGAAELVVEHDAGFVCDARDVDALAAHMRTLLDAGTRAPDGRERARDAVLPLTPAAMTLQLVLLYRDLLAAAHAAQDRAAEDRCAIIAARSYDRRQPKEPLSAGPHRYPPCRPAWSSTGACCPTSAPTGGRSRSRCSAWSSSPPATR